MGRTKTLPDYKLLVWHMPVIADIHFAPSYAFRSMVVEIVDCEEKILEILPELSKMVKSGIITLEKGYIVKA